MSGRGLGRGGGVETRYKSGEYLATNPSWHVEDSEWKAQNVFELLTRNEIVPTSVCDFGCGVGAAIERLQGLIQPSPQCVGVEPAPHALAMALKRSNAGLQFVERLQPQNGFFDVILFLDVLEHVWDYRELLSTARAVARYVVIQFPLDLTLTNVLRGAPLVRMRRDVGHVHLFTAALARRALDEAELHVIDSMFTDHARLRRPPLSVRLRPSYGLRLVITRFSAELASRIFNGTSYLVLAEGRTSDTA